MGKKLINTGLMWKEWKENRLIFLLALVVMSWDTIWSPLLELLIREDTKYQLYTWGHDLNCLVYHNIYHNYDIMFLNYGMWVCLLLGVYILSRERRGSLEYLVTTPVSRQEIIIAKFLTGLIAILGIVLVEAAVMAWGGSHLAEADYGIKEIGKWVFFTYPTLLAMFSIGLLAAALAGSIISSGFIALFILILPTLLNELFIYTLLEPLGRLLLRQPGLNAKITGNIIIYTSYLEDGFRSITSYLSIPDYLYRGDRFPNLNNYIYKSFPYDVPDKILHHITMLDPYYTFDNLLLLGIICLIFFITVKAFTAKSIGKKKLILFPVVQNVTILLISICLSQMLNWKLHTRGLIHTAPVYLLGFFLTALLFYTLLWLVICRITNHSFMQTCRSADWGRGARITGRVAAMVLLLALVVYAALPQLMLTAMELGGLSRPATPRLYEKPATRYMSATQTVKDNTIHCFNLSFSNPWGAYHKVRPVKDNVDFAFGDDRCIRVYKYSQITEDIYWFNKGNRSLRNLVYNNRSPVGYVALAPILNSSPEQVQFSKSRQEAMKNILQVVLKAEIMGNSGYSICHLTTPCIDGVQFPTNVEEVPPGMVYARASDSERASVTEFTDNHNQIYSIVIEGPHLKQSEVDQIISSVRFVE